MSKVQYTNSTIFLNGNGGNRIHHTRLARAGRHLGTCAPSYNGTLENRTPLSVLAKDKRRLGT